MKSLHVLKIVSIMSSVPGINISVSTVDKYIGHAEEAFMLARVKRYNVKGRRYIGIRYYC